MKLDKLKLIHNKNEFLIEINDTPINFVTAYKIESVAQEKTELTLKISIDIEQSSIDIDNKDIVLK